MSKSKKNPTPEEIEAMVDLIRLMVGDIPISAFYPILTDAEYEMFLRYENWNIKKAARRSAYSIVYYLAQVTYRERTGDIEVWNNASLEYRKALKDFLADEGRQLPEDLTPWVAGANREDVCKYNKDPKRIRSPLAQITHCGAWWTRVKDYECLMNRNDVFYVGC